MSPDAPERSLAQRMTALQRANEIRIKRASLKRDLKAGRVDIRDLILAPPDYASTAKVHDLLITVPKYGRVKVNKVLQLCRISPTKTLGGLSARQRRELVSMVMSRSPVAVAASPSRSNTSPDAQHMRALRDANRTRLLHADVKWQVAAGRATASEIVHDPPLEAANLSIGDLLMAQHRWGQWRTRKFLSSIPMLETKTLGSMTDRQRREIASRLDLLKGEGFVDAA